MSPKCPLFRGFTVAVKNVWFFYRYCQKFSDKFTSFSPIFEHESRLAPVDRPQLQLSAQETKFRSTVQLPISCPIREKITVRYHQQLQ